MPDRASPAALPASPTLHARFAALVDADGSATQPVLAALADPRAAARDLADAFHCLCLVHGRDAGMIATALARTAHPVAREWLLVADEGFARERDWLSRLSAAAGPLPSTPGQTESENVLATQRHTLDMLAQSERRGVAVGAAAALVADWLRLRPVLEAAGRRLYVEPVPTSLPTPQASQALLDAAAPTAPEERGFLFGAEQLLAQQRGLWALVESRRAARGSP